MSSSRYRRGPAGNVAAAGNSLATGTVVGYEVNLVTGADGTKGVTLPTPAAGGPPIVIVNNEAAQNLKVYPASGSAIDALGASNAFTLSGGQKVVLWPHTATQWYSVGAATGLSTAELAYLDGVTAGTGLVSKALVLDSSGNVAMPLGGAILGLSQKSASAAAITAARVLTAADSGGTFSVSKAAAYAITLPTPAQGMDFTFMVGDTGANIVTISDGAAHLNGIVSVNSVGVVMTGTTLSLASAGALGDWVNFRGISATQYLVRGACLNAADITIA